MFGITNEKLTGLREKYPADTRIRLIHMGNDPASGKSDPFPVPDGSIGYVDHIDDAGSIHMRWQHGGSLALIEGVDEFVVEENDKKWIQIWYSWGDQESPVEVPDGVDAWEYLKKLAVNEAEIDFHEHEEAGPVGLAFYPEEEKIVLHYPCDNTYCYYKITNSEDYEPDQEVTV